MAENNFKLLCLEAWTGLHKWFQMTARLCAVRLCRIKRILGRARPPQPPPPCLHPVQTSAVSTALMSSPRQQVRPAVREKQHIPLASSVCGLHGDANRETMAAVAGSSFVSLCADPHFRRLPLQRPHTGSSQPAPRSLL